MQLFSEHFLEFIQELPLQVTSIDELAILMSKNIAIIADELFLGKLDCDAAISPGVFEPKGKKDYFTLYCSPDGYTPQQVSDSYTYAGKACSIKLTSYAAMNHVWDDVQEQNIHTLHKCVFLFLSRCQLSTMAERACTHDQVTGLLNTNALLYDGLASDIQRSIQDYTGLFVNLKNFRYFNQNFGNPIGDEALRKYASRIHHFLQNDGIVTRPGGDNFAILVKNEKLEDLLRYLSTIRVNVTYEDSVQSIDLTSKVGICPAKQNDTIMQVLNNASHALSIAKRSAHHDHLWFRDEMVEASFKKQSVLAVFPRALEQNEFLVYYQPKVSSDSQLLCGCEALVRWLHDGELIPPFHFIPVLEQRNFICMLDFYMLEHVCQDLRRWQDSGITPVPVSVNFSKMHLHNSRLAYDIMQVLSRYNIEPQFIEIELTETSAYEDFSSLTRFLTDMQDLGIRTSIDDFGTGYSSLNLLKDLPINVIKLDRSFIKDIQNGKKEEMIVVGSIMNMVKRLGMEVVCEGVETKEQLGFLRQYGNPTIQGYLFDKPLTVNEFENRLIHTQYTI